MPISLIDVLRQGGCYWEKQPNSPGHSLAIPAGTRFRIALEGPQSHRFVGGTCLDGYFLVEEGAHAGARFGSANEAVNAVREPNSNAFLHIQFLLGARWVDADHLLPDFRCDEAEEGAIKLVIDEQIRPGLKKAGKTLESVELVQKAAEVLEKYPAFLDEARRRSEAIKSLMGEIKI